MIINPSFIFDTVSNLVTTGLLESIPAVIRGEVGNTQERPHRHKHLLYSHFHYRSDTKLKWYFEMLEFPVPSLLISPSKNSNGHPEPLECWQVKINFCNYSSWHRHLQLIVAEQAGHVWGISVRTSSTISWRNCGDLHKCRWSVWGSNATPATSCSRESSYRKVKMSV